MGYLDKYSGGYTVIIGIDIGQTNDPTAIVIADPEFREEEIRGEVKQVQHYNIRYLKRLPLGMSYPDIVNEIVRIVNGIPDPEEKTIKVMDFKYGREIEEIKNTYLNIQLYVDATGVGKPVVDLFREALEETSRVRITVLNGGEVEKPKQQERYINIHAVTLTGGEATEEPKYRDREFKLPKSYLVSQLKVLFSYNRIHLPDIPEARALKDELMNYQLKVNEYANLEFGAFKIGTHDDLITALGLACIWNYVEMAPLISFI